MNRSGDGGGGSGGGGDGGVANPIIRSACGLMIQCKDLYHYRHSERTRASTCDRWAAAIKVASRLPSTAGRLA